MNIQEIWRKCKSLGQNRDFLTIAIIVMVGTASFGLGRLSILEERKVPVSIEYPEHTARQGNAAAAVFSNKLPETAGPALPSGHKQNVPIPGGYVASKNGSRYYLPFCSGVAKIKEENKIWFASKKAAEKAGYTPAANCKGL